MKTNSIQPSPKNKQKQKLKTTNKNSDNNVAAKPDSSNKGKGPKGENL